MKHPEPPICTKHHFHTLGAEDLCQEHIDLQVAVCGVCDLTVTGLFIGVVPDCARHQHFPKG